MSKLSHVFSERSSSLEEVFDLAGNEELQEAEKKYLIQKRNYNAIILAASKGEQLKHLTKLKPKCMLDIQGKPLIERLTGTLKKDNIGKISIVSGYKSNVIKEQNNLSNLNIIENKEYSKTGELFSLNKAISEIKDDCIITYGDIVFRKYILDALLSIDEDIVIVVDAFDSKNKNKSKKDLVKCDRKFTGNYLLEEKPALLRSMHAELVSGVNGQWIGLLKTNTKGSKIIKNQILKLSKNKKFNNLDMPDLFNHLIKSNLKVKVLYIAGQWLDVNDAFDLAEARKVSWAKL